MRGRTFRFVPAALERKDENNRIIHRQDDVDGPEGPTPLAKPKLHKLELRTALLVLNRYKKKLSVYNKCRLKSYW